MSHQRPGEDGVPGPQVLALADAVIGYTMYCDQMVLMAPLVEHVANKHISLGVTREQYQVVGNILLAALEVGWLKWFRLHRKRECWF